ncbi:MAG: amidase [Thermaceae bacterium]|nr:amidase [Thermaceae bacterium]
MSQNAQTPAPRWSRSANDWEAFVARQVQEQTAEREYPLRQQLDFSPFQEALEQFGADRAGQLEALTQSATIADLQAAMAAGQLSSEELTLFYLSRIRRYNHTLRAYLELNPQALQEGRARDQERKAGQVRGPLHGIPIALKDNIGTAAPMHTTAGALALQGATGPDAFIVQKLRRAGAVILGKNNLSEWANFMTTNSVNGYSTLGGHTRNPYGPFDVGGSSSGTASAVAANLAVAGVGSETSGSLVYPAAQNSIFTLKPTFGLISRSHIIPISEAQDTAGPLTKNAADLAVLMRVLIGQDPADPATERAVAAREDDFAPQEGVALAGLQVGWVQRTQRQGDQEALERVSRALGELGAEVKTVPFPESPVDMLPVLRYGLREGLSTYFKATSGPVSSLAEVIAFNQQNPEAMAYGQDLLIASQNEGLSQGEYRALVDQNRQAGSAVLRGLMEQHRVSLLLTVSNSLSLFTSTSGFAVLNFPAGYRDSGEPIGASLVAAPLEDAHLIGVVQVLSQYLNLRKPPVW